MTTKQDQIDAAAAEAAEQARIDAEYLEHEAAAQAAILAESKRIHLGGDAYCHPSLEPLLVDIDLLIPHPENPRSGDQDAITESIRVNGLYRPCYAQRSTGHILAGNHTTEGVRDLGGVMMPVLWLDVDDTQARKILLADNRTADLGRYDEGLLLQMLTDLGAEADLVGTGYTDDDLALLQEQALADAEDLDNPEADNRAPTTSEMLRLTDVSWGEPQNKPSHGQVWQVGRHTLVVAKLHSEWHLWRDRLTEGVLFCPYPEPYLTSSEAADNHPLLLVQPNAYLAGHLLDKHLATHPGDTVRVME